jgi:hypothetical protein
MIGLSRDRVSDNVQKEYLLTLSQIPYCLIQSARLRCRQTDMVGL